MTFTLRFTEEALADLVELHSFLAREHPRAATRALTRIERAFTLLRDFPHACRKASGAPHRGLRELVISFGQNGYVALFRIEEHEVLVLAVRHQRESDFH